MTTAFASGVAVLGLALAGAAVPVLAQQSLSEDALNTVPSGTDAQELGFGNGSVLAVPLPFSNPTLGSGFAAGVAWLFTADEGSRSSSIGIGGLRSNNGSEGLAFGTDLNFRANRYQFSFLAGSVDLNYDFTAGSFDIPLNQTADLYRANFSYGFTPEFSLGANLSYAETSLSTDFGLPLPPEITVALDLEIVKFGLVATLDTRSSEFFPTGGSLVSFDIFRGEVVRGLGSDYEKAVLKGAYFRRGLTDQDAIAFAGTLCHASKSAPFFDACSIGLTDGFRGFSVTKYIGESLLSGQVEYRGRVGKTRLGYVAFAGAGSVGGTTTSKAGIHSAAGLGVRYRLSKEYPVDLAIDATVNSDDDSLLYLYVGQSF
ncbi:MAG: BamA/TamA family outer membrane protein [Roseobacter sp.]